jgi:hypothetical protein
MSRPIPLNVYRLKYDELTGMVCGWTRPDGTMHHLWWSATEEIAEMAATFIPEHEITELPKEPA